LLGPVLGPAIRGSGGAIRKVNKLTARRLATLDTPGRHSDGGGLYLAISKDATTIRRRWVFLFRWHGKLREMGLGSAATVSLAQARELAGKWRSELTAGNNPLDVREATRRANQAGRTFRDAASEFHADKSKGWKNAKVRKQWLTPLERYAGRLMLLTVDQIKTGDVLACLQPIWSTKPETASRVRGRIEAVLDAARARGLIDPNEANPARWRGHLSHLLPKQKKLSRGHHAAMPYRDVPEFVGMLREREAVAAFALEFTILTAARTSEVLGMRWAEIDAESRVWIVPGVRMKSGREHRVPLCARALAILDAMRTGSTGQLVFPSARGDRPLSTMAMEMILRRMKIENATVHGFRSSFRDWAGECTGFPREIAEAALAHTIGNEVERAYRRGDALEKRRELMEAWADYLSMSARSKVVPIASAKTKR
jgi:integrase